MICVSIKSVLEIVEAKDMDKIGVGCRLAVVGSSVLFLLQYASSFPYLG